jgi:hypothetical protein
MPNDAYDDLGLLGHHNRIAVRTLALASRLETVMRRVPLLAVLLAAAVLALGSGQLGTGAQDATPPAAGQGFVGAWRLSSDTPAGASQSLLTLMADGTVVFSGRPVAPTGGTFLWVVTDSVEMTLAPDGTSWRGPYSSTTADPSGNVLFIGPGTAEATRIMVQPLATPLATPAP